MKTKIYFAAPLFTSAEREWNTNLAHNLRGHGFEVELPQEFCGTLANPSLISDLCLTTLLSCDIVLVTCDGTDVDSGTAMEFGYAMKSDLNSIAYRTDFRRAGDCGNNCNLMIAEQATEFLYLPLANCNEVGRAILGAIERWKSTD